MPFWFLQDHADSDIQSTSTTHLSVQKHLATIKEVREKAQSVSNKATKNMIKKSSSKYPPAEYGYHRLTSAGEEV